MKKSEARSQKSEVKLSNLFVPGFKAAGIACGIKKNGNKDLALIYSEVPAVAAAVFTTNKIKAAPVLIDIQRIKKGLCQAVIINSGNANACTGKKGLDAAVKTVTLLEKQLGIKKGLVMVSSTGVIGEPLPIDKIKKGIPTLNSQLSTLNAAYGWGNAAEAIMTTDAFPKIVVEKGKVGDKEITILGIAKGGNREVRSQESGVRSKDYKTFRNMLERVCLKLAHMIVRDGEGATKFLEIKVKGAKTKMDAKQTAMTIANSLLVKTAFFGEDANWGRIMAAIGRAGIDVKSDRISIYFDNIPVVKKGNGVGRDKEVSKIIKKRDICLTIDLGLGKTEKTVWASDLSYNYVKINASYRS